LAHLEAEQFSSSDLNPNINASIALNVTVNGVFDRKTNGSIVLLGSYAELLFSTKSKIGWIFSSAMPTGWILLAILLVIVIFALPCFRQKGFFEVCDLFCFRFTLIKPIEIRIPKVFYLTHWLHIVFYAVLFIHATHFWKWFIGPFVLALLERLFTCYRLVSKNHGDNYIKEVNLLASKVSIELEFFKKILNLVS
jgi:hypothetical protein